MFSSAPRTGSGTKPKPKPQTKISPDVNNLIKSMMKSSKLSHGQQQYLDAFITSDKELPLARPQLYKPTRRTGNAPAIKMQHARRNRRQLETMIHKGDFEAEPYRPSPPPKSRADEIEKLSESMSRGDSFMTPSSHYSEMRAEPEYQSSDIIDEATMCMVPAFNEIVKEEIIERSQWLDEMISLGKGDEYEKTINSEIAVRMKRLSVIS
jgi:hypothetical protein